MSKYTPRQAFADAQAAFPFVVEQGRNIETFIYAKRYPTINYGLVVPVVTEGADWAIGTQFYKTDITGKAKIISGAASDIPFNQVTRDKATKDFFMVGAGWEWNLEEVNQAAMLGIDINGDKSFAAARSVEQLLYDICMRGTTEKNITGFSNDGNVTRTDAAASGSGSSKHWADKTPDQMLFDVNTGISSIRSTTNEIEWADTIALPPNQFRDIATRRLSDQSGMITVLEYLLRNNVYTAETNQPLTILPVRDLATASSLGGGRMAIYRRDQEVLRFHLPMPRRVIGVNQKSLMAYEDGVIARTGGVEWRLPGAAVYVDEIA